MHNITERTTADYLGEVQGKLYAAKCISAHAEPRKQKEQKHVEPYLTQTALLLRQAEKSSVFICAHVPHCTHVQLARTGPSALHLPLEDQVT